MVNFYNSYKFLLNSRFAFACTHISLNFITCTFKNITVYVSFAFSHKCRKNIILGIDLLSSPEMNIFNSVGYQPTREIGINQSNVNFFRLLDIRELEINQSYDKYKYLPIRHEVRSSI